MIKYIFHRQYKIWIIINEQITKKKFNKKLFRIKISVYGELRNSFIINTCARTEPEYKNVVSDVHTTLSIAFRSISKLKMLLYIYTLCQPTFARNMQKEGDGARSYSICLKLTHQRYIFYNLYFAHTQFEWMEEAEEVEEKKTHEAKIFIFSLGFLSKKPDILNGKIFSTSL